MRRVVEIRTRRRWHMCDARLATKLAGRRLCIDVGLCVGLARSQAQVAYHDLRDEPMLLSWTETSWT